MHPKNENSLQQQFMQLEKTLYLKHKFALIVAIFNHYPYRDKLIRKINRIFKNSKNIELTRESYPNFETFEEQLALFSKTYSLIHVVNNEERLYKETMPLFYKGLNYHRDGIAKENPVTIILWMLPEDVEDFAYNAPDMWSWHGGIFDFEIPLEDHENINSFPFIRLSQQEKEKKQNRIKEILDYLEAKPGLDDRLKVSLQQELAQLFYILSDYMNAETYTLKCLEFYRKKGNEEEMYRLYQFLETIYRDTEQNRKALELTAACMNEPDAQKKLQEYKNELDMAAQIRKSILPNGFPSYLYVGMLPASEGYSDFYDYTIIDKNRITFFIGDVDGKGLSAASLAEKCSSILKPLSELAKQPAECLQILNGSLVDKRDKENPLSVSLFYGLLDLESGDLEYSKAGKIAFAFIFQKDGVIKELEEVGGFPLGFFGNMNYNSGSIKLNKGDMICLCTDGLTETLDIEKEFWEDNRNSIYASLRKLPGMSAKNAVESFMNDINNLIKDTYRTNDITFFTLKL